MANKKNENKMPLLDFFNEYCDVDVKAPLEVPKLIENFIEGETYSWQANKLNYRPIGVYPTFMLVIKNPDGQEVSHWSCEEPDLEDLKKSSEKRGKVVDAYPTKEYWKKYKNGDFQLK